MAEQKYIDFINKIIEKTKTCNISWNYLDKNEELYQGMDWMTTKTKFDAFLGLKEKDYINFDPENSFFAKVGSVCLVLLVRHNTPANMYIVPYTYKKVVKLPADEYGEYITRLINLVNSQFPNADDFIDSFLKDD